MKSIRIARRTFLRSSLAPLLLSGGPSLFSAESETRKPPFRVLYSNDTTNTISCGSPWHKRGDPFGPELIEASVDEVAGRGVDVQMLQPGLGWIPWWKSKLYPAEEHYHWFKEQTGLGPDVFGKYMLAGGDMVQVFLDRCRKRNQVPFISLRMNDGHHLESVGLKNRNAIWASRFYVEHPEYRIGTDPQKWDQHVLNWAIPEVRAHKLAFVRELCENYDFAGFEMDFMRFYSLFPPQGTTSIQRAGIITDFVRAVRGVLDQTARGGRRRWLCARVPCYLAALDPLGLDLPAMAAAGLDMVNVSASYFTVQQTDLAAIRRMVPSAAVYLELCHSIWNGTRPAGTQYDSYPFRRATPEQMYTAAHLAYARGADGVSLFNFVYYREHGGPGRGPFCEPPFASLAQLGDRAWLARQPQHYILSPGWGNPFVKSPLPKKIPAGKKETFTLDLAPPEGGWKRGGRLRIQCEDALGESHVAAVLNGQALTATDNTTEPYANPYPSMLGRPEEMRAWTVPAGVLRDGPNRLEISLQAGKPIRLMFLDLGLA
jgi:hypothetical protein